MAKEVEITAIKFELDDMTKKYANKKLSNLYKYIPTHARKSASIRVNLEKLSKKRDDEFQAEVFVKVPEKVLTATGNATNMQAAIDNVEVKILSQIRRYKTETKPQLGAKHGVLQRVKAKFFKDQAEK